MFSTIRILSSMLSLLVVTAVNMTETPPIIPSATEQCQAAGFRGLCVDADYLACYYMICASPEPEILVKPVIYRPADEGTSCGINKICRNKLCVDGIASGNVRFGYYSCRVN